MRIKRASTKIVEGDLTPMIDMTFQLIAFFMVLINFTEADQNELIKLPSSVLAKPPEGPLENPIFLQLDDDGSVIMGGDHVPIARLQPYLLRQADALRLMDKSTADATVIIRADANTPTGMVQELIQTCQQASFERFSLRAREDVEY